MKQFMRIKVLNNFIIGENHLGKAVFAARKFKPGDVIVQFNGDVVTADKLPEKLEGVSDRYVQIDHELFLGPSGEADDFINHSCEPNAGLKFSSLGIILVAIKNIEIGEEITWDYSTTLYDNKWKMLCDCKKPTCRKIISDFILLDQALQKHYYDLEIIPAYIKEYMDSNEYLVYTKGIEQQKAYVDKKTD